MKNNIQRISHCTFTCKDYNAMKYFYKEILELPEIFSLPYTNEIIQGFQKSGFSCNYDSGIEWLSYFKISEKEFIELFRTSYVGENNTLNQGFHHICLIVSNIEETAKTLMQKGVSLYHSFAPSALALTTYLPHLDETNSLSFYVRDPEGNYIQLKQTLDS